MGNVNLPADGTRIDPVCAGGDGNTGNQAYPIRVGRDRIL